MKTSKSERTARCLDRLVRFLCPQLVLTRPESIAAIKNLNDALREQREETEKWRKRCVAVEKAYADQLRAMRDAAQEHEGLSWRCL